MIEFNKQIQARFEEMCKTGKLFRVALTGDQIWDMYISGFPKEKDPIFRDPNSTSHTCNNCKNFVRRYGNIVAIDKDFNIITMFDINCDKEYESSSRILAGKISRAKIAEVFFETFTELNSLPYETCTKTSTLFQLGIHKNVKRYTKEEAEKFGVVKANETRTFNHMHLFVPKEFVDQSGNSVESIMGNYRDAKNVFQRGMEEISLDTLRLVRDLIIQGSLLNGDAHLSKIEQIIPFKEQYDVLSIKQRDNWCWITSYKLPFAKFKNELIGVLCSELSQGEELNKACQSWNKRVDPANYMKATAPITKKQIAEAKTFVEENGYAESFDRRCATIDDIKASEILHINSGKGEIKEVSIFDGVKATATRHKRSEFDKLEEVTIDKFMSDILPNCTSVEAFLSNGHNGNMVTLTTANKVESKPIFKWQNNYSWTFNGNLAGKSEIKQAVKSRGGNVEGVMRVTLAFPNTTDDYDLHLVEPNRNHISYSVLRQKHPSSGILDLDAQGKDGSQTPENRVENIIYTNKASMPKGIYTVKVNNYSGRGLHTPFTIEVEIDGDITVLNLKVKQSANTIDVIKIAFNGDSFELDPSVYMEIVDSKSISREIYALETNQFHKVDLVCLSPNHWDDNKVGNKHYFFMLNRCKLPVSVRGFHNENLNSDLIKHKKVMEVLGATASVLSTDNQLSGLGFNATVRDELVVKLQGSFKRMIKIKF